MLFLLRSLTRAIEILIKVPVWLVRTFTVGIAFNPRLGPLRYVASAIILYIFAAAVLVYIIAPVRGFIGSQYQSTKLRYDAERWIATAVYDRDRNFVGTFDPRLDSQRDVNYTGRAIEFDGYVANPDHKSIPVRNVPEFYWQCLHYLEDRHLGGILNPFGIDFFGVLKIPYTSVVRSIRERRIVFGVGGSTLPMQLARVIYKTPPLVRESGWEKIGRKLSEWWTAPVIYFELTRGGDNTPLKQWAANHLWLAQRTGGAPLHGVEVTSRIVFGKEAKDLSVAEQFVLASAVNKPIILLEGSERLNAVRLSHWRYILEVRASHCASVLLDDPEEQKKALLELVNLAGGPPDPVVKPALQTTIQQYAPKYLARAQVNPRIRANVLMPSARLGLREEMKQVFGFNWRNAVRGIRTTLAPSENLKLRIRLNKELRRLHNKWQGRLLPGYVLDPKLVEDGGVTMPDVIVVAADGEGRIVRYFENSQFAPYFGSASARNLQTGHYNSRLESRQIASVGKMISAIAIANAGRDTINTLYTDSTAPRRGLETCRRNGRLRRGRRALVAFACSLNRPLEWRTAKIPNADLTRIIERFGFNMPPTSDPLFATPPSTAIVRGLISGSPQRVQHMAGVILAALTGENQRYVRAPTLVEDYEFITEEVRAQFAEHPQQTIKPADIIQPGGAPAIRSFLRAPICYRHKGRQYGTLRELKDWCAARRAGLNLHFAKTGTAVTADPDATTDTWVAGGLQFTNGARYTYVVVVGSGAATQPFARNLHSSQLVQPLLRVLLTDLEDHARRNPPTVALIRAPAQVRRSAATPAEPAPSFSIRNILERNLFDGQ